MTLVAKLVREREIIDREKYRQEYDRIFGVKPVSRAALPDKCTGEPDCDHCHMKIFAKEMEAVIASKLHSLRRGTKQT